MARDYNAASYPILFKPLRIFLPHPSLLRHTHVHGLYCSTTPSFEPVTMAPTASPVSAKLLPFSFICKLLLNLLIHNTNLASCYFS